MSEPGSYLRRARAGRTRARRASPPVSQGRSCSGLPVLMDFQDAAGNEKKALESRDQYLSTLALQRCQAQPMVGNSVGMPMAAAH